MVDILICGEQLTYRTAFNRVRRNKTYTEIRNDNFAGCLRTPLGGSGRQIVIAAGQGRLRARLMTAREAARLQGVPDVYPLVEKLNENLWGFGDAVCVPAITWIGQNALIVSAADPLDQRAIGAAVWYAATVKNAVIVAAAGNANEDGCPQNPAPDPTTARGLRDWTHVKTVSTPSWFSDYVLSVGAVDTTGAPIATSLAGPWVGVAAPGVNIVGLSPQNGMPVNAYPPARPGESSVPFWGTSFSAAYVSGVAALVRAKFPALSAHQVINRILHTAHHPPGGVDNQVGYGVVDPVAALTFNVPAGDVVAPGALTRVLTPLPPPPPPDRRAHTVAVAFAGSIAGSVLLGALIARARRAR